MSKSKKTITSLKQEAKKLKRELGISQSQALGMIAKKEGYSSWGLLLSKRIDTIHDKKSLILAIKRSKISTVECLDSGKLSLWVMNELEQVFKKVIVLSFGDSASDISSNLLSLSSNISSDSMKNSNLDDSELKRLGKTVASMSRKNIYISECLGKNFSFNYVLEVLGGKLEDGVSIIVTGVKITDDSLEGVTELRKDLERSNSTLIIFNEDHLQLEILSPFTQMKLVEKKALDKQSFRIDVTKHRDVESSTIAVKL